jgi:hypothetical protein
MPHDLWEYFSVFVVEGISCKREKLHDFAGSVNTSMKSCTLPGARTFFTIASAFVRPQAVCLAKLGSWKISFDNLIAQSYFCSRCCIFEYGKPMLAHQQRFC